MFQRKGGGINGVFLKKTARLVKWSIPNSDFTINEKQKILSAFSFGFSPQINSTLIEQSKV